MTLDNVNTAFRITVQENASVYSTPLSINTTNYTFPNPSFDFLQAYTTIISGGTVAPKGTGFGYARLLFTATTSIATSAIPAGFNNFAVFVDDASDWAGVYTAGQITCLAVSYNNAFFNNGYALGALLPCTTAPMPIIGVVPTTASNLWLGTLQAQVFSNFTTYYVPTTLSVSVFTW